MLVKTYAGSVHGVDARTITIEVNTGGPVAAAQQDKPSFFIVGLPDSAVREGYSRMEAAFKNSRLHLPRLKTIINLFPRVEIKSNDFQTIDSGKLLRQCQNSLTCDLVKGDIKFLKL